MQWVLLGIIVVTLLLMSSRYPKAAFSLLAVLVAATGILIYVTTDDASFNRQKLPNSSIQIENAIITPSYGGGYRFNARLVNTHDTVLLKESVVSITMLDCTGESENDCHVIGQTDERINAKIPAGQARDVSQTLNFNGAKPAGNLRWKYKITETRS